MTREQLLTLGMAGAVIIALVLAAVGFSRAGVAWGARLYARALELYFGEVDRLTAELVAAKEQSDRDYADYEALTRQYNKVAQENIDLQRLLADKDDMIRGQRGYIEDLESEKEELRQMVRDERLKRENGV